MNKDGKKIVGHKAPTLGEHLLTFFVEYISLNFCITG